MTENVAMDAEGSLHRRPRECDVTDVEEPLHQKPREVCITEDTESIDLVWFENTKMNRVNNGTRCLLQIGIQNWKSLGASPSMIQKGFCETVAEVMDAKAEGEDEIHHEKRQRVAERVPLHVPPERITILMWTSFFGQARILLQPRFLETPRYSEEQQYAVDILSWNPGF